MEEVKKGLILANKDIGETPLNVIQRIKNEHPKYKESKIAYAGRLDPMAKGLLLLLVNEECKKRDEYQLLDKEYTFKLFFGFSTDTYDILGMPKKESSDIKIDVKKLKSILNNIKKIKELEYPPYSSVRVKSKPLFWWARNNRLNEIEIPIKKSTINKLELVNITKVKNEQLKEEIIKRISKVKGDFRQEDISKEWERLLNNDKENYLIEINSTVSSGTYIRSIANLIGQKYNSSATVFEIYRTRVGQYNVSSIK